MHTYLYYMSFNKLLYQEYLMTLDQESVLVQFYLYFKQKENLPWRGMGKDACFCLNLETQH